MHLFQKTGAAVWRRVIGGIGSGILGLFAGAVFTLVVLFEVSGRFPFVATVVTHAPFRIDLYFGAAALLLGTLPEVRYRFYIFCAFAMVLMILFMWNYHVTVEGEFI